MKATDLSDALYNAIQFSKDTVFVHAHSDGVTVQAYDGFTYVSTTVDGEALGTQGGHYLTIAAAKSLQKALSALKDGTVSLTFSRESLEVDDQIEIVGYELGSYGADDVTEADVTDLNKMLDDVETSVLAGLPVRLGGIAFSPDRFRKLSLLKPSGLPLDMSFESDAGQSYAGFKYGPNTVGLISFLDRTVIKEEMGDDYVW